LEYVEINVSDVEIIESWLVSLSGVQLGQVFVGANGVGDRKWLALYCAASRGFVRTAERLLKTGANVKSALESSDVIQILQEIDWCQMIQYSE